MAVTIREVIYDDMGKCMIVSNGLIEAVVTVEFGPRIIRAGFVGHKNEFCDNSPATNQSYGGAIWRMRGGHRFWHSPECFPRTYLADNDPIMCQIIERGVLVTQQSEPWVQLQKSMEIIMTDQQQIIVRHTLLNNNAWTIKVAAWALSVMAPGGKAVISHSSRDTGLLPNRTLSLWPYSHLNDERIYWGEKYIVLSQENKVSPFKLGITNEAGWMAYFNHGNLFIKRYKHDSKAEYPDGGVSCEMYTNDFMLEMETLSPLTELKPGEVLTHEERWDFVGGVPMPKTELEIDRVIQSYIAKEG